MGVETRKYITILPGLFEGISFKVEVEPCSMLERCFLCEQEMRRDAELYAWLLARVNEKE